MVTVEPLECPSVSVLDLTDWAPSANSGSEVNDSVTCSVRVHSGVCDTSSAPEVHYGRMAGVDVALILTVDNFKVSSSCLDRAYLAIVFNIHWGEPCGFDSVLDHACSAEYYSVWSDE